uniref:Uncharacterized protein n=1 Tax=Anopheles atroparvus TaxID=41427 RepID=A0A182JLL3_ANOAO
MDGYWIYRMSVLIAMRNLTCIVSVETKFLEAKPTTISPWKRTIQRICSANVCKPMKKAVAS